jgi:hypothetical protein
MNENIKLGIREENILFSLDVFLSYNKKHRNNLVYTTSF